MLRVNVHAIGAAQLVAWGATYYAIPPLLPDIASDTTIGADSLSLAITIGLLLNAIGSLAVAAWIRRAGARAPMVTGSIVASLALVVLAAADRHVTTFAALALLGASHAALLYEPAFAAAARSPDPGERTRAVQVITFWGGWAGLWALPFASTLASVGGWRVTLLVLAAVLAAVTIGIHARLPAAAIAHRTPSPAPPISRPLAIAFALGAFASTAIVVDGVLLLAARDVSIARASLVLALVAPLQVVGRAWFVRRAPGRRDGALPFVLVATGIGALLAAPSALALAAFVVLFGAGAGLLTTIRAAIVVARVAPEHAPRQLARYGFVTSLARAAAPAGASWLHALAGHAVTLLALAALALVAAGLVWRGSRQLDSR